MAAGLGFKTFNTGDVLSAADVNGYLMQGVLVFASTAARDAAITAPAEGQFAFTKDTNSLFYYDGAAWVASGATGDIEGVTAGTGISGGGTSGTVTITNDMATTITSAGDIVVGTGVGTYDNLPIGTTNQVLTADTTVSPYKVKWATFATSATYVGCSVKNTTATTQTCSTGVSTAVTWDAENFDTNNFHSTSSNTSRMTIPTGKAGKYLITAYNAFDTNVTGTYRKVSIYKNGVEVKNTVFYPTTYVTPNTGCVLNLADGDYIEIYVKQDSGGTRTFYADDANSEFCISLIGA